MTYFDNLDNENSDNYVSNSELESNNEELDDPSSEGISELEEDYTRRHNNDRNRRHVTDD